MCGIQARISIALRYELRAGERGILCKFLVRACHALDGWDADRTGETARVGRVYVGAILKCVQGAYVNVDRIGSRRIRYGW